MHLKLTGAAGERLSDAIRAVASGFLMPCGGRGACGKCAVRARGALSQMTEEEERLLGRTKRGAAGAGYRWRMACCAKVLGEVEVTLESPRPASVAGMDGDLPPCDSGAAEGLGAAIDIGTTTVSCVLFDMKRGAAIAAAHEMNRQGGFGADVLSRIEYANRYGSQALTDCLSGQLRDLLKNAAREAGEDLSRLARLSVTGNTTMLHFLTGLDPRGIGVAPFTPASLFGQWMDASALLDISARMYLPRSISAYVGADITCGILATGLCEKDKKNLLVDVGTNGEMALWADGGLLTCATAAGPAFEGAQIAMGMSAGPGAISKVLFQGGRIAPVVIGGGEAAGLCGTGLISAVSGMIKAGIVDESGRFEEGGHGYERYITALEGVAALALGEGEVVITQKDVRAVQLAKAAIAAGIDTLTHEAGLKNADIDRLYLSGGFGSFIDVDEAAAIGLIPDELKRVAVGAGNSALSGAARLLMSGAEREEAERLARNAGEVSLSGSAYFMERYVENMMFGEM